MSDKPLIDFGKLSEPASKLIEKISDAIGTLYEPTRMVRKANAEIKIEKRKLLSKIELNEIEARAINRLLKEETRRQYNIEYILGQAIPLLDSKTARPKNITDDWLIYFFDKAKDIGQEEMQLLWAKILANEANNPGNFSKRVLSLLSLIDKNDAKLFQSLCQFVVEIGNEPQPIVFDYDKDIYKNQGINFDSIAHLESLGVIKTSFGILSGFLISVDREKDKGNKILKYFDESLSVKVKDEILDNLEKKIPGISIGGIIFTKLGLELYSVCEKNKNISFFEYLLQELKNTNYEINP